MAEEKETKNPVQSAVLQRVCGDIRRKLSMPLAFLNLLAV